MDTVPIVDYAAHPGFAGLPARANDPEIDALISDLDASYGDACSDGLPSRGRERFAQELETGFRRLLDLVVDHASVRPSFVPFVKDAFAEAKQFLAGSLRDRDESDKRRNSMMGELSSRQAEHATAVRLDGFAKFEPQTALAKAVYSKTWLERAILRTKARLTPGRHCAMALSPYSPAAKAIAAAVRESGVLDVASAYMGKPMEFLYAALDHAHPGQDWYKGCYADSGVQTSRTAYMHFDADSDMLKAMFYIADVGPNDGPFSYVRGSHLWKRSPLVSAVQNGFDAAQRKVFEAEYDGLDYKLGYYRPRFHFPEHRQDVLALPPALRGSTHFGDDIVDGSSASEALLREEVVFTGPAGTFVLFDGSRGIHRGSLAKSGERWAVQIGLKVRSTDTPPPVRSALKDRVAYAKSGLREIWRLRHSLGRKGGNAKTKDRLH
jgi:hypothetical protein